MESKLAQALGLAHQPVALVWSDVKPEKCIEFAPGKFSCVMYHVAAAAQGRTAAVSRDTFGCPGGGVGMGFGNRYLDFPGGCDCFCRFLSSGNASDPVGRQVGEGMAAAGMKDMAEEFLEGERYLKHPEAVGRFIDAMPIQEIPAAYVLFKPLSETDPARDNLRSITLIVDPDQLSALVVLANTEHPERENVTIPFAAGCQIVGVFMYREFDSAAPRALVGLTDLSARKNVRRALGKDKLSFSMTPGMFQRMEANVEGSFFQRHTWAALRE